MADVMIPNNSNAGGNAGLQKSGVKTLSIIDTISELATDKTEASRLTLPSPVRTVVNHPGVPPRNPKVSVPLSSPMNAHLGAKPRFISSSPKKTPPSVSSPKLNLSAIQQNNLSLFSNASQTPPQQPHPPPPPRDGQTPDWIRDIFHHAKRGNREKLVSASQSKVVFVLNTM